MERSARARKRVKTNAVAPFPSGITNSSWARLRSNDGTVDRGALLRLVQAGGVTRGLRPQVWPHLLCLDGDENEAATHRKQDAAFEEYRALTAVAGDESAAQAHYAAQGGLEEWATTSRRIDMDALRISPDCEAFSGGNRETGVARLTAVLRAYALRDAATGYCQGMSDLAAPLIYLFPSSDEQAYWCFCGLMRHMRDYFQDGLCHVQEQMSELRWLLQAVDPPLCRHLGAVGAGGCEFAFQMLMVAFRREIPWKGIFGFWEVLWASEALAGLPLRVHCVTAMLRSHRRVLLRCASLEDVVQFVNRMPPPSDPPSLARAAYRLWSSLRSGSGGAGGGAPTAAAARGDGGGGGFAGCFPFVSKSAVVQPAAVRVTAGGTAGQSARPGRAGGVFLCRGCDAAAAGVSEPQRMVLAAPAAGSASSSSGSSSSSSSSSSRTGSANAAAPPSLSSNSSQSDTAGSLTSKDKGADDASAWGAQGSPAADPTVAGPVAEAATFTSATAATAAVATAADLATAPSPPVGRSRRRSAVPQLV